MIVRHGNLDENFLGVIEHWRPAAIADLNGQQVRIVKFQGEFPWHRHLDAEEMFLVWKGEMQVEFRDGCRTLCAGDFLVVPRGVEHRTSAAEEVEAILFEPAELVNTGDAAPSAFTAPSIRRI
jgi:mannose-6-phosphate isomerase-like protein (cupin superfamily)